MIRYVVVLGLLGFGCEHGKGGGTPGPDGGPGGTLCGGFAGATCASDQWCDFGRDDCGGVDGSGVCRPRPLGFCDAVLDEVCGCDGQIHANPCEAVTAGFDISTVAGSCPTDPGFFQCGARQCNVNTQFCRRSVSDVGEVPDDFECDSLPPGCGINPSCACLENETCGFACSGDATLGFTLTCPGG